MRDLADNTIYLLKRAELAVRSCVEAALRAAELTPNQLFILVLVKTGEATSSAELARAMGVLPQSMTELIAPLEERGAIAKQPDPGNNRILRIALTAAGERLYDRAVEVGIPLERELFARLDERDRADLNRMLKDLIAQAESHVSHPKVRRLGKAAGASSPRQPRKSPVAKRTNARR